MDSEQVSYILEEYLEPTIRAVVPTPEHRVDQLRKDLAARLEQIAPIEGRFVVGQALLRSQRHTSRGWEDEPGNNQDALLSDPVRGASGVFDGMGGAGGPEDGGKASEAARDAFKAVMARELERVFILSPEIQQRFLQSGEGVSTELQQLRRFVQETLEIDPSRFASGQDVRHALIKGFNQASAEIVRRAPKGDTTVSLMVVYEDADGSLHGKTVNRGDSRIYRYRNGELLQLTKDDSLVQLLCLEEPLSETAKDLIKKGFLTMNEKIHDPEDLEEELSAGALRFLEFLEVNLEKIKTVKDIRRIVTSGVANEQLPMDAEIEDIGVEEGDLLISATDGVVDNLSITQLQEVIKKGKSETDRPDAIATDIAREARVVAQDWHNIRSKPDDMGVVVTRIQRGPTLKNVFENNYQRTHEFVRTATGAKGEQFLMDLTWELGMVRNQAEFALEGHPGNKKLEMLRDHIVEVLQLVGERQAELLKMRASKDNSQTPEKRMAA